MAKCFLNGLCGAQSPDLIKKPMDDPVLAPFIEVKILGSDEALVAQAFSPSILQLYGSQTSFNVGNRSFPAVVKSLQVGASRGNGFEIEVVDQEGGDFRTIFEKISRGGTATDNLVAIRWGWLSTLCDGSSVPEPSGGSGDPSQQQARSSKEVRATLKNVTLDYSFGVVKYVLHCVDMMHTLYDTAVTGVIGTNKDSVFLVDAIQQICSQRSLTPSFKKFSDAKTETEFQFKLQPGVQDPKKGPKGVWQGLNRSVLACIYDWLKPYVSQDGASGRGLMVYFNPENGKEIIIMSSTSPVCEGVVNSKMQVATYIANGGDCSPVINFKPNISFTAINAYAAGGTGGGHNAGTNTQKGPSSCLSNQDKSPHLYNKTNDLLGVGLAQEIIENRNETITRKNQARRFAYNNKNMNNLANLSWGGITAELKIQGDPSYSHPLDFLGRFVNIIVINPFAVEQPCRWLNTIEPCNEILSSANWIIDGVSHDIRDGSFTTTLKVRLIAPGYNSGIFSPIGATTQK